MCTAGLYRAARMTHVLREFAGVWGGGGERPGFQMDSSTQPLHMWTPVVQENAFFGIKKKKNPLVGPYPSWRPYLVLRGCRPAGQRDAAPPLMVLAGQGAGGRLRQGACVTAQCFPPAGRGDARAPFSWPRPSLRRPPAARPPARSKSCV